MYVAVRSFPLFPTPSYGPWGPRTLSLGHSLLTCLLDDSFPVSGPVGPFPVSIQKSGRKRDRIQPRALRRVFLTHQSWLPSFTDLAVTQVLLILRCEVGELNQPVISTSWNSRFKIWNTKLESWLQKCQSFTVFLKSLEKYGFWWEVMFLSHSWCVPPWKGTWA